MNTFYYLDGLEIKEIKTVKDFEFIKSKVNKKAVKKSKDIVSPYGHKLKGIVFEETPAYIKEKSDNKKAQDYEQLIQDKIRQTAIKSIEAEKLNVKEG